MHLMGKPDSSPPYALIFVLLLASVGGIFYWIYKNRNRKVKEVVPVVDLESVGWDGIKKSID